MAVQSTNSLSFFTNLVLINSLGFGSGTVSRGTCFKSLSLCSSSRKSSAKMCPFYGQHSHRQARPSSSHCCRLKIPSDNRHSIWRNLVLHLPYFPKLLVWCSFPHSSLSSFQASFAPLAWAALNSICVALKLRWCSLWVLKWADAEVNLPFLRKVVVDILCICMIIIVRLHAWVIRYTIFEINELTPSSEILSVKIRALCCLKPTRWVSCFINRVFLGEKLCCNFCEAFWHKVLVHIASTSPWVSRYVLSPKFMSRSTNPVFSVFAPVSVDISTNCHFRRKVNF